LGILPFFWGASLTIYLWGKRYLGEPSTAFAVLCFTFLPAILAHSGLATTDMALTATVGASFLAAMIWLDRPSPFHSLILGAVTGLAVLSKFSALVFIPAALGAALIWYLATERPRPLDLLRSTGKYVLPFFGALLVSFLLIWAGYRFSFGEVPFYSGPPLDPEVAVIIPRTPSFSLRLPAPELYAGIQQVMDHNDRGHDAYLLGEYSESGWWFYYFVVLAVKTPLPFLGLVLCGFLLSEGRRSRGPGLALAFSLGILLVASFISHINIGVRHVLPVYTGFAIVAGVGASRLLEVGRTSKRARWILGGLLLWLVATSALSHPDYLPYFNALAGREPEQILVDSDLDWGQDMKRLTKRLDQLGVRDLAFTQFFPGDVTKENLPSLHPFDPTTPSPGWNAASITGLKLWQFKQQRDAPKSRYWPAQIKPTEKVGKGIWLWYFPTDVSPERSEVR
jgi:4-amino-4-deoxy-L-arabinose transferase-like glycosyltransferase